MWGPALGTKHSTHNNAPQCPKYKLYLIPIKARPSAQISLHLTSLEPGSQPDFTPGWTKTPSILSARCIIYYTDIDNMYISTYWDWTGLPPQIKGAGFRFSQIRRYRLLCRSNVSHCCVGKVPEMLGTCLIVAVCVFGQMAGRRG